MPTNALIVNKGGIAPDSDYLSILRAHAAELSANGMEYEEHDYREPVTAVLITLALKTAVTVALSEVIKKIVSKLCEPPKAKESPAPIQIHINNNFYLLPQQQSSVLQELDRLTITRHEPQ